MNLQIDWSSIARYLVGTFLIFFVVMLLPTIGSLFRSTRRATRYFRWTPTEATVTGVDFVQTPPYDAIALVIRARYDSPGGSPETIIVPSDNPQRFTRLADALASARGIPAGTILRAAYDPSDPHSVVVGPSFRLLVARYVSPTLLALFLATMSTINEYHVDLEKALGLRRWFLWDCALGLFAALIAFGVVRVVFTGIRSRVRPAKWEIASATVGDTFVVSDQQAPFRKHVLNVGVTFRAQAQDVVTALPGYRLAGRFRFRAAEDARREAEEYPPGTILRVRYNPDKPHEVVLAD